MLTSPDFVILAAFAAVALLCIVTVLVIALLDRVWRWDCGRSDCDQRHNAHHRHVGRGER